MALPRGPEDDASPLLIEALFPTDFEAAQALAESAGVPLDCGAEARQSYSRIWVARFSGNAPIAGILVTWDVADEQQVMLVATAQWALRRGVATRLMQRLIEHARSRGARRVLLEVRAGNLPAGALYRGFGFRISSTRKAYYRHPTDDALQMELEL